MKRVYIAHPLRGDFEGNMKKVDEICKGIREDVQIFSPLHAYSFIDANGCQKKVLADCIAELSRCDELWIYGDEKSIKESQGVQAEIKFALAAGIPTRYKGPQEDVLRVSAELEKIIKKSPHIKFVEI